MYAKIDPSGCYEFHGNVRIRFAFYLEPGDARYDECRVQVPVVPAGGYPGAVDQTGNPVDQGDYDRWHDSLPRIWRDNPFHNHFVCVSPDVSDTEVKSLAAFHLANFYEAWRQKKPVRSGWDIAHRVQPVRFDGVETAAIFRLKQRRCEQRLASIERLTESISVEGEGRTFPATVIEIGLPAIDRAGNFSAGFTNIDFNNAANESGVIDTFEMWFVVTSADPTGVKVGTFVESIAAPDFTSRDVETLGAVTKGSKQTFTGLSVTVVAGDWPGVFFTTGGMELDTAGFSGVYFKSGDQFGLGSQTYAALGGTNDALSLFGTGDTVPGGWAGGNVLGVSPANITKINGVEIANIAEVNGVA